MAIGNAVTQADVNTALGALAVNLRGTMQAQKALFQSLNGLGLAGLEALGFSPADAQSVLNVLGYLNTIAGVYYGTVQQGGTGGTGATTFNFDNALSQCWGVG